MNSWTRRVPIALVDLHFAITTIQFRLVSVHRRATLVIKDGVEAMTCRFLAYDTRVTAVRTPSRIMSETNYLSFGRQCLSRVNYEDAILIILSAASVRSMRALQLSH